MYLRLGHCYRSSCSPGYLPAQRFPLTVEFQMANNMSQKKRNRQNEKRRQNNMALVSDLKTSIKKVETAAAAGEPTDALYREAQKKIDVAADRGVLHANTAARKKSRLATLTTVE